MDQALPEDLTRIWQRVRDEVRASLPASTYKLWLEPLRPLSIDGHELFVTGPERVRTWVERRYAHRLERALREHTDSVRSVVFVTERERAERFEHEAAAGPNLRHTFERFVVGSGNRLAHGAALAVAELPGDAYNPLFLHGPPGLGKTHLLGAITTYVTQQHPELAVRYTTGERFTSEFVAALRGSGVQRFKQRHRELDMLLIDDVQFLQDKSRTEEEFFHTFDAVHERGGQIVLASDQPPHRLSRLTARLRDRFEWGLMVELGAPDLPTRLTVLGRLASEAPLVVEAGATLREIAASAPANLRQLEGALTRVLALASITSREPTPELAREALSQGSPADPKRSSPSTPSTSREPEAPSVAAIQDAVCATFGITRTELLSSSRTPRIAKARHMAMYVSRQLTGLSLAEIAREFNRDHSTVLHAIRRIDNDLTPGSDLHDSITNVQRLLSDPESDR